MRIDISDDLFDNEQLANTPKRWKRFMDEWDNKDNFNFTTFKNEGYKGMIIQRVEFHSLCSHHVLPFFGVCYVGYIPSEKLITGFSKLARVVDKFSCKPQVQELMTQDIVNYLVEKLKPKGVMVVVKARHLCMEMRGIKKSNSWTVTSAIDGVFKSEPHTKNEFFELVKLKFQEI